MVKHVNGFVAAVSIYDPCRNGRSKSISEENRSRANAVSTSPQIHRIMCAPLAMDDEKNTGGDHIAESETEGWCCRKGKCRTKKESPEKRRPEDGDFQQIQTPEVCSAPYRSA